MSENKTIEKGHTIQEIFDLHPELKFKMITILSAAGLQCVGPESDLNKALEDAVIAQGGTKEQVESLIRNLNVTIPNSEIPLFIVTERAENKIHELLDREQKSGWGFKFALKPGGCSGFEYDLRFEEKPEEGEKAYAVRSVKVFVADRDFDKLKYSTIDYQEGLMNSGFQIQNPNATGSCGCGVSNSF